MEDENNLEGVYCRHIKELFDTTCNRSLNDFDVLKHFPSEFTRTVKELWDKTKPQLLKVVDDDFHVLLDDFKAPSKFSSLEVLRCQYSNGSATWEYSGIPNEDYSDLADTTIKDYIPQYESLYLCQMQEMSQLWDSYSENLQKLAKLEEDIKEQLASVKSDRLSVSQ